MKNRSNTVIWLKYFSQPDALGRVVGCGVSLIIEYLTSLTGSKWLNEREMESFDLYRQVFN
jgi:hypothetical protein